MLALLAATGKQNTGNLLQRERVFFVNDAVNRCNAYIGCIGVRSRR